MPICQLPVLWKVHFSSFLQCLSIQISLKFNVFALQSFLGGHHHKSAPSTPRNPGEDQWDISALEREKVNKMIIVFIFAGINMF